MKMKRKNELIKGREIYPNVVASYPALESVRFSRSCLLKNATISFFLLASDFSFSVDQQQKNCVLNAQTQMLNSRQIFSSLHPSITGQNREIHQFFIDRWKNVLSCKYSVIDFSNIQMRTCQFP
jgi:hypothetical protein